jgi:hypothetical protein
MRPIGGSSLPGRATYFLWFSSLEFERQSLEKGAINDEGQFHTNCLFLAKRVSEISPPE